MKPIQRIAITGAGAIGSVYASMFREMGAGSVSFIADNGRHEQLQANGIVVNGKRYAIPVILWEQTVQNDLTH